MPTENRSSNTELSKIVTEALVAMASAVTRTSPPAGEPLPGFIQGPIDRAVERIGRLLAQPAAQHQGEPVAYWVIDEFGQKKVVLPGSETVARGKARGYAMRPLYFHPPTSDGFSAGDMADQGAKAFAARDPEVEELRVKLAEAQEVLRDCIEVGELDAETQWKAERVSKGRRLYVDDRALSVSSEQQPGNDWHMNPCRKGHRDVGACNGKAFCHQCDEMITATTTQEAFEQWNATHPASGAQNPTE